MSKKQERFCVVGLGNPGKKYELSRHNLGFWVLDALHSELNLSANSFSPSTSFSPWHLKGKCEVSRGEFAGCQLQLLKPQAFMNLSGQAAKPLLDYFNVGPAELLVVYDELDLAPGTLRFKKGGSSGGHKGVQDLINCLGSADFLRLRLGIGHPRTLGLQIEVSDWVLSRPAAEEKDLLLKAVKKAVEGLKVLFSEGLERAQMSINSRVK